jgi:hypothetical protein
MSTYLLLFIMCLMTTCVTSNPLSEEIKDYLVEMTADLIETSPLYANCEAGTYIAGYNTCLPCPEGTISVENALQCTICEGGTFSNQDHTYCHQCKAGSHSHSGSTECTPCSPGFVSHTGAHHCTKCPSGFESSNDLSQCIPCRPGLHSKEGKICTPCSLGYISREEASTCSMCQDGTESNLNFTKCVDCQPGFHSSKGQMCTQCPLGSISSFQSGTCTKCSPGSIATSNQTQCILCPAGTIPNVNHDACVPCPNGTISGVGQHTCTPCEPGTVAYNRTTCVPCTAGSFGNIDISSGIVKCTSCNPGHISASADTSCKACLPGTYVSNNYTCTKCTAGTYAGEASTYCPACPNGTISDIGASTCTLCPAGTFTTDHVACHLCQAGTYSGIAASSCQSCREGTYSTTNATTCTTCHAGYISTSNSSECTPCHAGNYTFDHVSCLKCRKGTISSFAATLCTVCDLGSISSPDNSQCIPCPVNTYSEGFSDTCISCEPNTYSGPRSSHCFSCPKGSNFEISQNKCIGQANGGCPSGEYMYTQGECLPCLPGNYSKDGSTSCTPCPVGSISSERASSCTPCSSNTFTNDSLTCYPCHNDTITGFGWSTCIPKPNVSAVETRVAGSTLASSNLKSILQWILHETTILSTQYCNKDRYDRGVGDIPTTCPSGTTNLGGLCYDNCGPGREFWGTVCADTCPAGSHGTTTNTCQSDCVGGTCTWPSDGCGLWGCSNMGLYCYRWIPAYGWDVTCSGSHPYRIAGLCCSSNFELQWRNSYGIPNIQLPTCPSPVSGQNIKSEYDAGLCYYPPRSGYGCMATLCYENCPSGVENCPSGLGNAALACASGVQGCTSAIIEMVTNIGMVLLNIVTLGTGSEFTKVAQIAEKAAKLKKPTDIGIDSLSAVNQFVNDVQGFITISSTMLSTLTSHTIEETIACQFGRYSANYNQTAQEWASILIQNTISTDIKNLDIFIVSVLDPTDIIGLINAFVNPTCEQHHPFPLLLLFGCNYNP